MPRITKIKAMAGPAVSAGHVELGLSGMEHPADYLVAFYRRGGEVAQVTPLDCGVAQPARDGRFTSYIITAPRKGEATVACALVNSDTGEVAEFCDLLPNGTRVKAKDGPAAFITSVPISEPVMLH